MSWIVVLEVEQAACMKSQLSWAPLAKGCGVVTRSYHEAINIRRRPRSTLSIISAGTQLSLTLNQLVTQLSLSPQLREQKKHTLHPVKNIASLIARRCTLSQSRTSPRKTLKNEGTKEERLQHAISAYGEELFLAGVKILQHVQEELVEKSVLLRGDEEGLGRIIFGLEACIIGRG
jgi:hypothetical protein